jgi:uncharacterized membrane protein SpoIIM required for sporulation
MKKGVKKSKVKKKERQSLFESFTEVKEYLINSKKYVYLVVGLFFLFTLIGFFLQLPMEISEQLLEYFRELIEQTKDYGPAQMIWFLFQNNIFASFLGVIGGLLLGVFPLINGMMNGFVLGFAANLSVSQNGIFSLWRLFPHGIFELPALFISLGIGLRVGGKFLEKYWKVKGEINQAVVSLLISLPLLLFIAILYSTIGEYISFVFFILLAFVGFYFFKEAELRKEMKLALNTFFKQRNSEFIIDVTKDLKDLIDYGLQQEKTGLIILGAGVVKHHVCNANLFREGADYSVYINAAQEFDGSDAGATPNEAMSWGKLKTDEENTVKIFSDVTLVFPLIVAEAFKK